jgi:hypothetical protein
MASSEFIFTAWAVCSEEYHQIQEKNSILSENIFFIKIFVVHQILN